MVSTRFDLLLDTMNPSHIDVIFAAMSSSRSDVVTKSVHPSVRPFVMKEFFFSIKSYNGVSRKSKGCFNEV